MIILIVTFTRTINIKSEETLQDSLRLFEIIQLQESATVLNIQIIVSVIMNKIQKIPARLLYTGYL